MGAILDALAFIIGMVFNIYAMLLAVRFIMQVFRADYYNPLAQFIVTATDPVLKPVRRFIPSFKSYDTSSLLFTFVVLLVKLLLLKTIESGNVYIAGKMLDLSIFSYSSICLLALVELVNLLFNVFIYAMFIRAILSWFPNPGTDAIRNLLAGITEPIVAPIRKRVPPIGMMDLSMLIGMIAMYALKLAVVGTLLNPFVGR